MPSFLCLDGVEGAGFASSVTKTGAPRKKIDDLGMAVQQPTGVWHTFEKASTPEEIIKDAFSREFPLGADPPLPDWLLGAIRDMSGKGIERLRSELLEKMNSLSAPTPSTHATPSGTPQIHQSNPRGKVKVKKKEKRKGKGGKTLLRSPVLSRVAAWRHMARICGVDVEPLLSAFKTGFPAVGFVRAKGLFPDLPPPSITCVCSLIETATETWQKAISSRMSTRRGGVGNLAPSDGGS